MVAGADCGAHGIAACADGVAGVLINDIFPFKEFQRLLPGRGE
jgi:hypothetical protein